MNNKRALFLLQLCQTLTADRQTVDGLAVGGGLGGVAASVEPRGRLDRRSGSGNEFVAVQEQDDCRATGRPCMQKENLAAS